jgi:hypothetical protein
MGHKGQQDLDWSRTLYILEPCQTDTDRAHQSFYDPVNDNMIEPSRPGISYSFTSDGFYEEAYYRAISNPANPACPGAIMQWQHGSYVIGSDGSLTMTPIAVDGRQLLSQPCQNSHSIYTRYNTTEKMKVCLSSSTLYVQNTILTGL